MELTTECKCACANCGQVIDYRSTQAGQIVECPQCKEQSRLPEPAKMNMVEVFGPPVPKFRNCPVCGTQINFWTVQCPVCEAAFKKKRLQTRLLMAASALILLVLAGAGVRHFVNSRAATIPAATIPIGTIMLPKPQIIMEQPHPRMPKSTNDLRPGRFVLQQSRGSDLVIAVGDIENISDNTHTGMKADLDLLDKTGAKIGTVSDYFTVLGPRQSWHFVATVTQTNAASVRFAGIKED